MKKIFIANFCLYIGLCATISSAQANSLQTNKVYIGGGAGVLYPKVDGTNYIGTGSGWPNDHYVSQSMSNDSYFFLAGGYTWVRQSQWFPYYSLGVRYVNVPATTVSGYVDQYSDTAFRNYDFQYDIQLQNILATFKADIFSWKNWMPYLTVSAGVANYRASTYTETATADVTPRVSPGFSTKSGTNLTYALGAGLDYALLENVWINLEYNYNYFGTIKTGNGANTSTLTDTNYSNESLKNKITASALSLGATWYLG